MELDKVLLIPYLSKELGLLGIGSLPYSCQSRGSDDGQVLFDNNKMLTSLISCCFDLVKRVKQFDAFSAENPFHQVKNEMLKANMKMMSSDLNKLENQVHAEREKYRQLNVKFGITAEKLKTSEEENKKLNHSIEIESSQLQTSISKLEIKCQWYCQLLQKKLDSDEIDLSCEVINIVLDLDPYNRFDMQDVTVLDAVRRFKKNCMDLKNENRNLKNIIGMILDHLHDLIITAADKMNQTIELEGKTKVKTKFLNTKMSSADAQSLDCYIQHVFVLLQQLIQCVPS